MKKLFTLILISGLVMTLCAQAPTKMSYQAVIRNASGALVTNHAVGMRISILQGSATGTVVYRETYSPVPQTNANGLLTVDIGGGTPSTGTFSGIDWVDGPYYLKTETDPTGGTSYTITGTSQLLSVPYALFARTSDQLDMPFANTSSYNGFNFSITNTSAHAVRGIAASSTGSYYGVYGQSFKYGVYGLSTGTQGRSVMGEATGTSSIGVCGVGVAESSTGVWGEGSNQGVYGFSELETGKGVYGRATSAAGTNYGIYGQTSSASGFSGYFTGGKFYVSGNTGIGTGTTTPVALFHVQGTGVGGGNVVFIGEEKEVGYGDPPVTGTGTRMMWYPDRAAFRAGYSSGTSWDKANIGRYSVAMGIGTVASEYAATALGYFGRATGRFSTALGLSTRAESYSSTSIGRYNVGGGDVDSWTGTDPLFEIGNGTSYEVRSNAMTVLKNGNVGIGTATPAYKLQVGVAGDGTQARANAWNLLSDVRLKKDLKVLPNPLDMLEQINGYYFYWNTGSDIKRQVGFSAQEISEVLPEAVSKGQDDYLSVDYGKITPLLVEAIKQLKAENDELKERLEKIEKSAILVSK